MVAKGRKTFRVPKKLVDFSGNELLTDSDMEQEDMGNNESNDRHMTVGELTIIIVLDHDQCSFNVCSLRRKGAEIEDFISTHGVHILGVAETWLSAHVTDGEVNIPQCVPQRSGKQARRRCCLLLSYVLASPSKT